MDAFHLALLLYYIGVSSSSLLVVKFTENSGGKLIYNVTSAVLITEIVKLLLATLLDKVWFDSVSNDRAMTTETTTWRNYCKYSVPSLIYAVQNNLLIYGISLLGPSLFALFSNLKIVTTTLLTGLVLSRNFTKIQWMGVVMLVLSFFVAKADLLLNNSAGNCVHHSSPRMLQGSELDQAVHSYMDFFETSLMHGTGYYEFPATFSVAAARGLEQAADGGSEAAKLSRFMQGLVCVVILSVLSGSAAISNEYLLKSVDANVSFMRKNMWTYQWGAALNFVYLSSGYVQPIFSGSLGIHSLFDGYSSAVIFLIVINALLGLSVSMVMKYFDNVVKCFASSLVVYFTSAFAYFYFGATTVNGPFMLAVIIFTISSFLYMGSHNESLPKVVICAGRASTDATRVVPTPLGKPTQTSHDDEEMQSLAVDRASGASADNGNN